MGLKQKGLEFSDPFCFSRLHKSRKTAHTLSKRIPKKIQKK
jgi:hypothetical protein